MAYDNMFAVATFWCQVLSLFITCENSTFRGEMPPLNYNEFE